MDRRPSTNSLYDSDTGNSDAHNRQYTVNSYIRLLHNINNESVKVDVYFNSCVIAYNLSYNDFTQYINVTHRRSRLIIKEANTDNILSDTDITLSDDHYYTGVICGTVDIIKVIINQDKLVCPKHGNSALRFIGGTPNLATATIVINGQDLPLVYGETSKYISTSPGVNKIIVKYTVESVAREQELTYNLSAGGIYSVVLSSTFVGPNLVVSGFLTKFDPV